MSGPGPLLTSPLVSAQWLADHLGAPKLVVLDATVLVVSGPFGGYVTGHEQYLLNGHIPGAVFADLLETFSDPDGAHPFTRPRRERFEAAAGAAGVDNETTVVVYDSVVGQWAARIWWLFRSFGYDRVAVLDGGYTKWVQDGRATETGHVEPLPTSFAAPGERQELWADKAQVERVLAGHEQAALVCGVPPKEFAGDRAHRARGGHIPGSISVPAGRLVERESKTILPADALRERFGPAAEQERVIAYCGGGIAAAADALALTLIGHENVAIYDGSLNEWAADPQAPLVTAPPADAG